MSVVDALFCIDCDHFYDLGLKVGARTESAFHLKFKTHFCLGC